MSNRFVFTVSTAVMLLTASFLTAHEAVHEKAPPEKPSHWTAPEIEGKRPNPVPGSTLSVLRGKDLYMAHCAGCHGSRGDGRGPDVSEMTPKPSDLGAMAGHHPDGDLAWKIKTGRGGMPGWKEVLSEDQIWDLVNFIQSLTKEVQ